MSMLNVKDISESKVTFVNEGMTTLLNYQKEAYLQHPYPLAHERIKTLNNLKRAIIRFKEPLIEAMNKDFGNRSRDDSLMGDIIPSISAIHYASKRIKKWMKPQSRTTNVLFKPARAKVIFQPLGVVGIIVPWNYPLFLALGPLVTALAAGNRAMIKLSEFTPYTNKVFRRLISSCFDEGEVAVIEGDSEVAAQFSSLPFDHLLFTGSTEVGKHVMRAAASNLTPVTLELGGKSPALIEPNMSVKTAVNRLIWGKTLNAGQTCVCTNRIFVQKEVLASFTEKFAAAVNSLQVGNGVENDIQIGPMISSAAVDSVIKLVDKSISQGAILHTGGRRHQAGSHFFQPTILTNVTPDMSVARNEIFGPVSPIISFDNEDEVIAMANDTEYGLAAYFYARDIGRVWRVAQALEYGMVGINESIISNVAAPFGGVKQSGSGREGSKYGLDDYLEIKYLCMGGISQ